AKNGILDENGLEGTINWIGNVHALFIDGDNIIYEDTNQDGKLDPKYVIDEDIDGDGNLDEDEDVNNNGVLDIGEDIDGDGNLDVDEDTNNNGTLDVIKGGEDKKINIYFSNTVNRARGCYTDLDMYGQCLTDPVDECNGDECVELEDINYLWSANEQLRKMDVLNEPNLSDPTQSGRRVFTWNDFDNNGVVDDDGVVDSDGETFWLTPGKNWAGLVTPDELETAQRGPVVNDFLTTSDYDKFIGYDTSLTEEERAQDAMDAMISWLLGEDSLQDETSDELASGGNGNGRLDKELRSRQYKYVTKDDAGNITGFEEKEWRLGDVVYSSPLAVSKPAENFHLIYRDPTYKKFVEKWSDRRTVIYFGGNDGMLHAMNSGFYKDEDKQFYCSKGYTGIPDKQVCTTDYNLGEELWAYVPYNLQPHLKCLADKFYEHKYYVDLEPRIADVQIFPEDEDHPGGWGTILIGGMRFGGAPIEAQDVNGCDGSGCDGSAANTAHDVREFSSSYFILDITNPVKPRVLGELTRTIESTYVDLNYTTNQT
ncbi:MAG: hypothetical protein D3909_14075, partial [Candidatus Electrothrix sp. ATG1]|nr:hypothetical protein [Candidatus Electrothrix sp. ATG1]